MHKDFTEFAIQFFEDIEGDLMSVSHNCDLWVAQDRLLTAFHSLKDGFSDCLTISSESLSFVFSPETSVEDNTRLSVELINRWHRGEEKSCVSALVASALQSLGFVYEEDAALMRGVLIAAVLAEVPNDLSYHNNMHFRKVVLNTVRMIVAHNMIFEGTAHTLDKEQIAVLLIAAAIHDLGHDGTGNIIDRKYVMARVEKRSYSLARPYLEQVGIKKELLDQVLVMLITTDVSPFGDPISPANQMRAVYEYHYGDDEDACVPELNEELSVLIDNPELCMMCLMIHEADLMTSAGLCYDITKRESVLVSKEDGRASATPEDTLLFLEKICRGEMVSDSARFLASRNLEDIMTQIMQDFKDGNKSYF